MALTDWRRSLGSVSLLTSSLIRSMRAIQRLLIAGPCWSIFRRTTMNAPWTCPHWIPSHLSRLTSAPIPAPCSPSVPARISVGQIGVKTLEIGSEQYNISATWDIHFYVVQDVSIFTTCVSHMREASSTTYPQRKIRQVTIYLYSNKNKIGDFEIEWGRGRCTWPSVKGRWSKEAAAISASL